MGVGAVLDITQTALLTQRAALEVTGHNIANAETEGYSRQSVSLSPRQSLPLGRVLLGTGVQLDQVQRAYNAFASMNIDRKTSTLGDLSARDEYLGILQSVFNETEDGGLENQLSAFWAGWQDVANNPGGTAERLAVVQHAEELVSLIGARRDQVVSLESEVKSRVTQEVDSVNDMLSQVATLNNEIVGMEAGGASANDLRDQRDLLLHKISESVGVNYFEQPNGQTTVFIAGRLMVDGGNSYELDTDSSGGQLSITWHGSLPTSEDISSQIDGGKLGGYLTMLQDTLPGCVTGLDDLASSLVFEVNSVHSQGVGKTALTSATMTEIADDPTAAMSAAASGLDFHDRIDDSGAASLKVHVYDAGGTPLVAGGSTITITAGMTLNQLATAIDGVNGLSASVTNGRLTVSAAAGEGGASFAFSDDSSHVLAALGINTFFSGHDAGTIAVSATADNVTASQVQADSTFGLGDGRNALAIADLADSRLSIGGTTQTFGEAAGELLGDIGVEAASVGRQKGFQEQMIDQLVARRDSQTGVSLDEELSNMLKFQHAYTAAAKLLTVADDMLKTLVEMR